MTEHALGWRNRIAITITYQGRIEAPLENYPVLIHLSVAAGINGDDVTAVFDHLESATNRKKIVFTASDGCTELYAEIVEWDHTNEEAWIYVRVPSIAADANTTIYLYYDKAQNDNTTFVGDIGDKAATKVWDSMYNGVYHGKRIEDNGTIKMLDSTSNAKHAILVNTTEESGLIGKSVGFNGSTAYGYLDNSAYIWPLTGAFTVQALSYAISGTGYLGLIGQWVTGNSERSWFGWRDNAINMQTSATGNIQGSTYRDNATWFWFTGRRKADNMTALFVNDGARDHLEDYEQSGDIMQTTTAIGSISATGGNPFYGRIAEVRVTAGERTDAWRKADYHSLFDNLVTFGTPVELPFSVVCVAEYDAMDDLTYFDGKALLYGVA